ncbi:MAG TPA: hypothetical protein VF784_03330, partial [Anaerolineales bacterium]
TVFHPLLKWCERVELIRPSTSATVIHAGGHEKPDIIFDRAATNMTAQTLIILCAGIAMGSKSSSSSQAVSEGLGAAQNRLLLG